ncbi:RNA 2',3'-cyclic phosphodiesterase [Radiobacillus sp. PE A8.2]|uniref:RNA 2',3'-cyclic phosphodiesterase n=1 Tax=Radiobacillus sp. PE A8.2 TaxID=3380349 RepID=UPI0038904BF4
MTQLSHYFIAIPLDKDVQQSLAAIQNELKKEELLSYKLWPDFRDLHITVKFLGPVAENTIKKIGKNLEFLSDESTFQLTIGGLGTFGNPNKPRVLWAGVEKEPTLLKLYNSVEQIASDQGMVKENRSFNPHITLAKKWNGETLAQSQWNAISDSHCSTLTMYVKSLVIYQIHPSRTPKYEIIKEVLLK